MLYVYHVFLLVKENLTLASMTLTQEVLKGSFLCSHVLPPFAIRSLLAIRS